MILEFEMFNIPLDKDSNKVLRLILAGSVSNIGVLRSEVLSGNLNCCIIKPTLVIDHLHVAIAANKAVLSAEIGKLKTKSIYSELLFNLSPSKNITQSLKTFGIGETDANCLFAIINVNGEDTSEELLSKIEGDILDIGKLTLIADHKEIKKIYKVLDEELETCLLVDAVSSRIATKDLEVFR